MPPKTQSSASEWAAKIIKNKVGHVSIKRCLAVWMGKVGCGQDRGIPVRVEGVLVDTAWSCSRIEMMKKWQICSGSCAQMRICMLPCCRMRSPRRL
jgi:hypothetical protein